MALMVAMVMVNGDGRLSERRYVDSFTSLWLDHPRPRECAVEGDTLSCKLGFDEVVVARMPAPIPWSDLQGPCETTMLWKEAADQVPAHTAHYIVTVMAELGPMPLAALLTRVVAAVLDATPGAIGVYWGSAPLVVSRDLFLQFATEVLPKGPPLVMWVDFRVYRLPDGASAGFTSGLAGLGFREIEAARAHEKPSELYARLQALAEYVVTHPTAIKSGDTVGGDAHEKIRVRFAPSQHSRPGQVMALEFEPPSRRPWCKYGESSAEQFPKSRRSTPAASGQLTTRR